MGRNNLTFCLLHLPFSQLFIALKQIRLLQVGFNIIMISTSTKLYGGIAWNGWRRQKILPKS